MVRKRRWKLWCVARVERVVWQYVDCFALALGKTIRVWIQPQFQAPLLRVWTTNMVAQPVHWPPRRFTSAINCFFFTLFFDLRKQTIGWYQDRFVDSTDRNSGRLQKTRGKPNLAAWRALTGVCPCWAITASRWYRKFIE